MRSVFIGAQLLRSCYNIDSSLSDLISYQIKSVWLETFVLDLTSRKDLFYMADDMHASPLKQIQFPNVFFLYSKA